MGFEDPTMPTIAPEKPLSRSEKNLEQKRERFAQEAEKKAKTLKVPPEEYVRAYADNEKRSREQTGPRSANTITKKLFGLGNTVGEALNSELHDKTELQIKLEQQKELATRDQLTGLLNRRGFDEEIEKLQKEIRHAQEQQKRGAMDRRHEHAEETPPPYYSIIFLDADHFKRVNDTYGHPVGDIVLGRISEVIRKNVRANEGFAARLGGEELIVALRTDVRTACAVAERIRSDIQKVEFHSGNRDIPPFHVTVSAGVAPYEEDVARQIKTADTAVYAAKGEMAKINTKELGIRSIVVPDSLPTHRNQIWSVQDGILSRYDPPKKPNETV